MKSVWYCCLSCLHCVLRPKSSVSFCCSSALDKKRVKTCGSVAGLAHIFICNRSSQQNRYHYKVNWLMQSCMHHFFFFHKVKCLTAVSRLRYSQAFSGVLDPGDIYFRIESLWLSCSIKKWLLHARHRFN